MPERITWVGHATVAIEMDGTRLLTDPVLRGQLLHLRRHAPPPDAQVVERLDAVLISHLHVDHLDLASLRRVDRATTLVGPPGLARLARRAGFATTIEVVAGDRVGVGALSIAAVDADHDPKRWPISREAGALGFVVAGTHRVYFAGDTDVFDEMRDLAGDLDIALLPVWGWGPRLGPGHMDPEAAARAAALLAPRVAVPIHWGTLFPLGLARRRGHLLVTPPRDFADHVARVAPGVRVEILEPGATLDLPARVGR